MARRRRRPAWSTEAQEQLAGLRATADGVCAKPGCGQDGIILQNQRITRYKNGWAHVSCMSGWDDE